MHSKHMSTRAWMAVGMASAFMTISGVLVGVAGEATGGPIARTRSDRKPVFVPVDQTDPPSLTSVVPTVRPETRPASATTVDPPVAAPAV